MFPDTKLYDLENRVKNKLTEHRYIHTLRVRDAALKIADFCYAGDKSEIAVAAMLHDISKEYSVAEQFDMMRSLKINLTDTDLMSEPVFHSFTAPIVIKNEFADFATPNVISAVFSHTTGSPDMSLFDEIIFVADYIEDGRKYEHCKLVRKILYDAFASSKDREECIMHLHNATIMALDHTIINLINNKKVLNERTVASRNAFLARVPMPLSNQ